MKFLELTLKELLNNKGLNNSDKRILLKPLVTNHMWPKTLLSKPQRLGDDGNFKLSKRRSFENDYAISQLSLTPHTTIPFMNLCGYASPECSKFCLNLTGRGQMKTTQIRRMLKSLAWHYEPDRFIKQLENELKIRHSWCLAKGLKLAVRLNTFSDVPWENYLSLSKFPYIQFYDYTKIPSRVQNGHYGSFRHYHFTFSRSEINDDVWPNLINKVNVAVVFQGDTLPIDYKGYPVIDGDESDLRFIDYPFQGCIIGLREKGSNLKNATSNFKIK